MAEHAAGPIELVEVKAEDIMEERQGFYDAFMDSSKWAIIGVVAILVLMAIFLV
jgi:hypothetical protein